MLERRSNAVSGWVRFPVNDPDFKDTHEGGMVVKLVVIDVRAHDDPHRFEKCCGGYVRDILSESFVGDDQFPFPTFTEQADQPADLENEQARLKAWDARHFPRINEEMVVGVDRFISREYLAVLVIGTTGWSGFNDGTGRYFECVFNSLTDEGQLLYRQIAALYPGARLHLLTFLDT